MEIRIGLIGSGFMGRAHALGFAHAPRVFDLPLTVVLDTLADATQEAAKKMARQFGFAHATGNWEDLLRNPAINLIDITSPNALHKPMAMAAIAAGKHVYCEKPLAPSAADCLEMTLAAEKAGVKLTLLPLLLKACAHLLRELPDFNSALAPSGKALIRKKYLHLGFAVDTPDGLLVPVIRNVEQKGLLQLAKEASELADKARKKKLSADEMQGACFTITSLGHIGGSGFTPIVNAPEVAILGVNKASMQPVWDGKAFAPRLMLPLSLSYDHRVINGAAAAKFCLRLAQVLADIRTVLL